ncbi:hypothetical protein C8J56DRAFT_883339 [Mycena floridula]|nr:hypothetical protein C8J56DRAFT_883339 [Mycena floridula]
MSSTKPTVGLLVPIVAKPEKSQAVSEFLLQGYQMVVDGEPLTQHWFAVKYADSDTYAVFDAFAAEPGRSAHLNGKVAEALMANADTLLSSPPDIGSIDILASKVVSGAAGLTAGLVNGIRVLIQAKPEKVDAVRQFLINALPIVEAEPETLVWYAIEYPEKGTFGIVDFFPSEDGRNAHIGGKVAAALFASVDELFTGPPDLVKLDVLAAKL